MDKTLKITNVLSDPTRYSIYNFMIEQHKDVSVTEVAKKVDIHPNVARLHLSKLESVDLVTSFSEKTGKGGRPSKKYRLSIEIINYLLL